MKIAIIGMGALGLLFADLLQRDPSVSVGFIADEGRRRLYKGQRVSVNGVDKSFRLLSAENPESPADLVIFAVKSTALDRAMEDAAGYVGKDTIIFSVLNGISSEQALAARFGSENLVYCVAQGMDAVREGRELSYSKCGMLCIGLPGGARSDALDTLAELLERTGVPYVLEPDIMRRMWGKFMLNVGVNQVVMVCEGDYGTVQRPGEPRDRMIAAMREVMALSRLEGIPLAEKDLQDYVALVDTLAPEGMPSMRQDGLARRRSEVELFSGTVCRLAAKHGLDVPVNRELYRTVQEMEAGY